jgi:hypothetical protein
MAFQFMEKWHPEVSDVEGWYKHFEAKGIPAAIVERGHSPRFTVWRGGKEARDAKARPAQTRFLRGYEILRECHGFAEEVYQ